MSLKSIKGKIRSVKKIRQVTRAMEAVSAVKMRKSQQRALAARPYAEAALSILSRIASSREAHEHPLLVPRPVQKNLLLVITADRGLAGSLNSAVVREASKLMAREKLTPTNTEAMAIGRKAREFFERNNYRVQSYHERWGEGVGMESPNDVVASIVEGFMLGAFDRVYLVYTNFRSTFTQEPTIKTFLPVSIEDLQTMVAGIVPEKGKYALPKTTSATADYLFEPSIRAVMDVLVPQLLSIELYHAVLESNASEHSARMVAMKTASDRARDLTKELTLQFNKARQSAITNEISELVGGIEAMT